ncbi:signal peptidase I [Synergistales bacterium]|nr:signal peptidase I [Synergistales bacterium]GHV53501.1 signal peptidase I [Synergistales bacterium]
MAKPMWREIAETVVYALLLALLLRTFVIQAFWIPSGSMIPTLDPGDRVLVLKFWYSILRFEPKRGDIVVFRYPIDPSRDFVKRVIGLPGDSVEIKDGRVFINSRELAESYVQNPDNFTSEAPIAVPKDKYFCLGDNRPNSQDSRFWGFVPKNYLRGPAVLRYWPPSRIGRLE